MINITTVCLVVTDDVKSRHNNHYDVSIMVVINVMKIAYDNKDNDDRSLMM